MKTYVKLEDSFHEHHKVMGLSDAAYRLYIGALCYAGRNTTDGLIHAPTLLMLLPRPRAALIRYAAELITSGLWEAAPDGCYQIHDYLEHQRAKADIDETRRKDSERKKDGFRSDSARHRQRAETETKAEAKTELPLAAVAVLPVTVAQAVHAVAKQPNHIARAGAAWERQSPGGASAGVQNILTGWLEEGIRIEYIEAACEAARTAGCHKPPKYVETIIRRYQSQGSTEDQRGKARGGGTSQGNGAVRQGDGRHLGASQRVPGAGVDWEQEAKDQERRLAGAGGRDQGLPEGEVG